MKNSNDVESAVVFKGQPVDDESSVGDDLSRQKAAAAAAVASQSQPQPCWKRHKVMLLGTVAAAVIVAAALTATVVVKKGKNQTNSASGKLSGVGGLDAELPPTSEAPTISPSASPSVTPQWDILYQALDLDFTTNSEHEINVMYKIGVNRDVKTEVFARDCKTAVDMPVLELSTERTPLTIYQDLLEVKYKVDKTALTGSNVWVEELNEIQICQVVKLLLPTEGEDDGFEFVIAEDKRTLDMDITLSVNFGDGFQVPLSSGVENEALTVAAEGLDEILREEGSDELP